jgi:hypothetical protein
VPAVKKQLTPGQLSQGLSDAAHGFSTTFTVALVLIALTLVPAAFLPKQKIAPSGQAADELAVPAAIH